MSQSIATPPRTVVRKAGLAAFLGTVVEAYDFFVYLFLISYMGPLFFPSDDPWVEILSSFLALGTAFLARPIGALIFGRLGDRLGRRPILIVTISGMGAATVLLGALPTYAAVGVLAPILLVLLRLVQGLSAGGEIAGAATFATEHAGKGNHGFLASVTPIGFAVGSAVAPGVVALTAAIGPEGFMAAWGWRIPFLVALPLTALTLLIRIGLEETPEFRAAQERKAVTRSPLRELLKSHGGSLVKVTVVAAAVWLMAYVAAGYMPLFFVQELGVAPGSVAGIATFANGCGILFSLVAMFFVDRLGRKVMQITVFIIFAVVFFPIMWLMVASDGNIAVVMIGQWVLAGLGGAVAVPTYAILTASFPPAVRYTAVGLGIGIGSALGGGFAPYLAGQAYLLTGNAFSPVILVAIAAIIGIIVIARMPNRGVVGAALVPEPESFDSAPVKEMAKP